MTAMFTRDNIWMIWGTGKDILLFRMVTVMKVSSWTITIMVKASYISKMVLREKGPLSKAKKTASLIKQELTELKSISYAKKEKWNFLSNLQIKLKTSNFILESRKKLTINLPYSYFNSLRPFILILFKFPLTFIIMRMKFSTRNYLRNSKRK